MGIKSIVSSYLLYNEKDSQCSKNNKIEDNKNGNFSKILKRALQTQSSTFKDENTGIIFDEQNFGNKTYTVGSAYIRSSNDKEHDILFLKFKRKKKDNLMTIDEVQKYIGVKDGEVYFKKAVDAETLYKITKSLNDEFYLAVDHRDIVVPISTWHAHQIFTNKSLVFFNKKHHIDRLTKDGKNIIPKDFKCLVHCWFNKNVRHKHPYAYSDMVINKQVKNYTFTKKSTDGTELRIYTQFSNELTNKFLTPSNPEDLKSFVNKLSRALNSATKSYQDGNKKYFKEYIFAMPFPLYDRCHMLSIVVAIRPNGDVNVTIINANNSKNAETEYARPIAKILQNAFKKYAPRTLAKKAKYFFQENRSQLGPTCMTHADCITRQIVKDENLDKDCKDIHPMKILEKAYLRGFATTLYQQAVKQNMFIADDIYKIQYHDGENFCRDLARNEMKNMYKELQVNSRKLENNSPHTNAKTYFRAIRCAKNRNNMIFKKSYKKPNNKRFIKNKYKKNSLFR